jgi:hypothetical protein
VNLAAMANATRVAHLLALQTIIAVAIVHQTAATMQHYRNGACGQSWAFHLINTQKAYHSKKS